MNIIQTMQSGDFSVQIVLAVLIVVTIYLLSGNGGWLVVSKKDKGKVDEKTASRIIGLGLTIICVFLVIIMYFSNLITPSFVPSAFVIILLDCLAMIGYLTYIGKKKKK